MRTAFGLVRHNAKAQKYIHPPWCGQCGKSLGSASNASTEFARNMLRREFGHHLHVLETASAFAAGQDGSVA
jgi:hypothetical protein